ncbi:MAG: SDR family NAD(P)-dependent oxidoreductase [Armatimonadetes bacterium]|nr:SDR family NAD(P)-dependent oxidoreductase [Armatimonadota bacterium]MDE2207268.1 SDR family NAD(P)-dependent oxidoreductase [Armatimonadota bacterium]
MPAGSAAWKRCLIIGASSGIGEQLALQLADSGCDLALVSRRQVELDLVAAACSTRSRTSRLFVHSHDVRHFDEVPGLFQEIARELGGLDMVIYSTGVLRVTGADEYDFEIDREAVEVNLLGAMAWLNEAALRFQAARAGTIIGISSVAGERGRRGSRAYGAAKAALTQYLESLRNSLTRYGVNVVTIKAGPVATPMTEGMGKLPLIIPADVAAKQILRAAHGRSREAYVPRAWGALTPVLRIIPSPVFRKLSI